MIESKYGLKYPFPHSVVHIVDNSAYTGNLPVTVVDDPSLYTSIVVTGSPMGEDGRLVNLNRSDVANVAYGMANLDKAAIEMYGQSVTYPSALLAQNVPVRLLRVTAEDATYGFNTILMEWRWDDVEKVMHVRFKTSISSDNKNGLPQEIRLSAYKNTARLNAALVAAWKNDAIVDEDTADKFTWKRRVLINNISAGRGSVYNKYATTIDRVNQGKRPANIAYLFGTLDTLTDQVVEEFTASLVNKNSSTNLNAIEAVNTLVKRRIDGSSILVPYVNEAAITELYNEYITHLNEYMTDYATGEMIEYLTNVKATLSINTFDVIYGHYIYNGDPDVMLPLYQVDMPSSEVVKLDDAHRIEVTTVVDEHGDYTVSTDDLTAIVKNSTVGIDPTKTEEVHIGEIHLETIGSGSSATNMLSVVALINQYSGNITNISTQRLYKLTADNVVDRTEGAYDTIQTIMTSAVDTNQSTADIIAACKKVIHDGPAITDRIVAVIPTQVDSTGTTTSVGNMFYLFYVENSSTANGSGIPTEIYSYDMDSIYKAMFFGNSSKNVGSVMAIPKYDGSDWIDSDDEAATKTGFAVFGQTTAEKTAQSENIVQINYTVAIEGNKVTVKEKYPTVKATDYFCYYTPSQSSTTTAADIVGVQYDIMTYKEGVLLYGVTNGLAVVNAGTKYIAGDQLYVPFVANSENTKVVVSKIEASEIYRKVEGEETYEWAELVQPIVVSVTNSNSNIYRGTVLEVSISKSSNERRKYDTASVATTVVQNGLVPTGDRTGNDAPTGLTVSAANAEWTVTSRSGDPLEIDRYIIAGTVGSIFRINVVAVTVPSNYYSGNYGLNPSSEYGGIDINEGSNGFFDDYENGVIDSIEFKWRYSALLTRAFKGEIDPRIMSPTRCPAKFLFDFGANTIYGQTILPYIKYQPSEIVQASTIFTDDEKELVLLSNTSSFLQNITKFEDIDVKQAMYDLMEYRCYQGIPEDKRPIGPGSGLSLHLDSGITDANTAIILNKSFSTRFTNPNASWDIGGFVSATDGVSYTYTKQIVDNLFRHIRTYSINKPFVGKYSAIPADAYTSFFPDIDTTDWEMRELMYNSGGNAWIMNTQGELQRRSQRSMFNENSTSDLIQESNMRTLSQLTYLLQNKIDTYLLEYNDDTTLKAMSDDCNIMFTNWVGRLVDALEITFERDINIDGGEIVICYCNVTFRGLILRVPIIVNIQRRTTSGA